ncbi:MAG: hypothetical protein R2852_04585 [Bacteroidia bacterium]
MDQFKTMTIRNLPDVQVSAISALARLYSGNSISVGWTIKNTDWEALVCSGMMSFTYQKTKSWMVPMCN